MKQSSILPSTSITTSLPSSTKFPSRANTTHRPLLTSASPGAALTPPSTPTATRALFENPQSSPGPSTPQIRKPCILAIPNGKNIKISSKSNTTKSSPSVRASPLPRRRKTRPTPSHGKTPCAKQRFGMSALADFKLPTTTSLKSVSTTSSLQRSTNPITRPWSRSSPTSNSSRRNLKSSSAAHPPQSSGMTPRSRLGPPIWTPPSQRSRRVSPARNSRTSDSTTAFKLIKETLISKRKPRISTRNPKSCRNPSS